MHWRQGGSERKVKTDEDSRADEEGKDIVREPGKKVDETRQLKRCHQDHVKPNKDAAPAEKRQELEVHALRDVEEESEEGGCGGMGVMGKCDR